MKKTAYALGLIISLLTPVEGADGIDSSLCYSDGWTKEKYLALKKNNFDIPKSEINELAIWLEHCLADPDPAIRDGVAYEGFFTWLRAGSIEGEELVSLFSRMSAVLNKGRADQHGVYLPFVSLVYSEVVRVDRVEPYLDDSARQNAVDTINNYLSSIDDYRGFEEGIGYRHGVAHGADVVLQLALNKELKDTQLKTLGDALATQINPKSNHFYRFGEPERLARAFAYILLRDDVQVEYWKKWIVETTRPTGFESWRDVFMSESGLSQRNNVRQFLTNLYAMISSSENARLVEFTPTVLEMIGKTN